MRLPHTRWLLLMVLLFGVPTREAGAVQQVGEDALAQARAAMQAQAWGEATRHLTDVLQDEPERLEARYLRGICYGQRGKQPTVESRMRDFLGKGREDFEFVLARDSLYRDVLYQYALLWRFDEDYPEAIRLGHAQIRLKPELAHAQVGLFSFYWRYLVETNPDKASAWLRAQRTDHADLFLGELRRRRGWPRASDTIIGNLLNRRTHLSTSAILLARARTHFAWNKPESATEFVRQAIASIHSEADALYLFNDIKYIATPAEIEAFVDIEDPADYRPFFEAFWAERDPMPAAPYNARMVEHYRRLRVAEQYYLFHGFRSWHRSPYTSDARNFPPTYALSSDFDDRGVIFIRHGEPDDYTVGDAFSWMYVDSLMIFHFAPTCVGTSPPICSVTKHFTPVPRGSSWGGRLVGLDPLDAERKSGVYLTRGLTTDRHRWPERTELIDIPYLVAAFRGEGGRTLVEVHYAVPLGTLARALDRQADSVAVEVGMTMHDQAWHPVRFFRETKRLPRPEDRDAWLPGRFQVDVRPDSFQVAFHGRSLQKPLLGAYRFGYRAPRFNGPGLKVSDLLLAENVIELEASEQPVRDDFYVQVNPLGRFRRQQPVFVYFEIYDLTPSPEGRTRYRVTYTLTPERAGGLRGLFERGREGAIALTAMEQEGTLRSPVEHLAIDMTNVPPGDYALTVTVQDERTGAVVERSRPLVLESN